MGGFGGGGGVDRLGGGNYGYGFHQHAIRHFGRFGPGYGYDYGYPDCYDLYYRYPNYSWPLSCG
jgi:hypothetical protein